MAIINQKAIGYLANQAGQLKTSIMCLKPNRAINMDGLKYVPDKLMTDTIELSQTVTKSRKTVKQAIKEYFSATTSEAKEEAYAVIDKYIQKLAKNNYVPQKGYSYEDYLQDFRLSFCEKIEQGKGSEFNPRYLMIHMTQWQPSSSKRSIAEAVPDIEKFADDVTGVDLGTEAFKKGDFYNYIVSTVRSCRKSEMLKWLMEGQTIENIGERLGLTRARVIQLLKSAVEEASTNKNLILSDKYLAERSKFGVKAEKEIIKRWEANRCM